MTRCDYDTIFQRVFCVTLVAIAFTFTVILTNVFVDIDGLLSRKDKVKTYTIPETVVEPEIVKRHGRLPLIAIGPHKMYKEGRKYDEEDNSLRNKRSLESQNFIFHLKNPKMKSLLTDRLATLLEELDQEESPNKLITKETSNPPTEPNKVEVINDDNDMVKTKKHHRKDVEIVNEKGEVFSAKKPREHRHKKSKKHDGGSEEDLLHLAMHNILLQGIIGHMDLNEVYKRVHSLVKNFKDIGNEITKKGKTNKDDQTPLDLTAKRKSTNSLSEENKFLEEIVKCDTLEKDITNNDIFQENAFNKHGKSKKPKITIKTVIDITSLKDKKQKESNSSSNESIKGIIKLIYNGKAIKFSRMEDDNLITNSNPRRTMDKITETTPKELEELHHKQKDSDISEAIDSLQDKFDHSRHPNLYLNRILGDYIKKNPDKLNDFIDVTAKGNFDTKRLKRQIKIRYEDDEVTTSNTKPKHHLNINKKEDDELYVEIETHFNGKGMKSEKKKKLIRSLIDKIQKAVQSDIKSVKGNKKKHRHIHIKKRIQHPLDKKNGLFNKLMIPFDAVIKRESDPISKVLPQETPLTKLTDKYGDSWRKAYEGPGFLTASKALNSAEKGEVDIDYSKVLSSNGIPKRLQTPLNTDGHINSEEQNPSDFYDVGNLKFFIKNIDGAGLSIGFNQYMDEPPDPETIKIFTGIENLVNTYQNNYDEQETTTENQINMDNDDIINRREVSNTNEHVIIRRSIKELHEEDYHANEYKMIFNSHYLPYKNYRDIFENSHKRNHKEKGNLVHLKNGKKRVFEAIKRKIEMKDISSLVGDKKLKPSEILSLANILKRKKRSVNVKRISNLRNKIKLSRFLNTHPKGTRKIIYNNKRSKRQIDKIRIIATDHPHSNEQVYVVSDENLMADRAIIRLRGRQYAETPIDNAEDIEIPDAIPEEPYTSIVPVLFRGPDTTSNFFANRYRHNPLMSKYPHIFMEEIARSKEDYSPNIVANSVEIKRQQQYPEYIQAKESDPMTTEREIVMYNEPAPKVEDIVNAIDPQTAKQNYKLTVRVMPKNMSGVNAGFKEIHTSINKSFDQDGVTYVSLLNVSEISKIEMLHKPTDLHIDNTTGIHKNKASTPETGYIKRVQEQQKRMDMLLKNHKKRIDDQLAHLRKERLNLEIMELKNDGNLGNAIDSTRNQRTLAIEKENVNQLLASALINLKTDQVTPSTPVTPATEPPVYIPVTESTVNIPITEKATENYRLYNSIEKNENLTTEILHQLNKNTEMLQVFLLKLATDNNKKELPKPIEETRPMMDLNIHKFMNPPPLHQFMPHPSPNVETSKNESHVAIPFVYAYQHPFPLNNYHPNTPLASVVYHGHIHTNNLHKGLVPKADNKESNQTKYFIDDLESDFKVVPAKKPLTLPNETSNSTTLG